MRAGPDDIGRSASDPPKPIWQMAVRRPPVARRQLQVCRDHAGRSRRPAPPAACRSWPRPSGGGSAEPADPSEWPVPKPRPGDQVVGVHGAVAPRVHRSVGRIAEHPAFARRQDGIGPGRRRARQHIPLRARHVIPRPAGRRHASSASVGSIHPAARSSPSRDPLDRQDPGAGLAHDDDGPRPGPPSAGGVEEQPVTGEQGGDHALFGDLGPPGPVARPPENQRGVERTAKDLEHAEVDRAAARSESAAPLRA